MAGGVERGPHVAHLAVHHPARSDRVGTGTGLRHGHGRIPLKGGVVVDAALLVEDPAVPVVGELVEAEVGHHRERVADLGRDVTDRDVEDPVARHAT